MRSLYTSLISFYQIFISSSLRLLLGPGCRFSPSCSQYAKEAIGQHGIIKGTILTFKRLSKCHPFGKSGYDPVPK